MERDNKIDYEDECLEMVEKANKIVLGFTASSGATGAIPIPFADAPLLITQQVTMMVAINDIFGFDIKHNTLRNLVTATIGAGGATVIGKTVTTNFFKLIPGVGSIVGGAMSGGTAGIITLSLGKAYIAVCKAVKMGELDSDDLEEKKLMLKKVFKEQMKTGKNK